MADLIRKLCDQMARGLDLDVAPFANSFVVEVSASEPKTSSVKLVPAAPLTLSALKDALGPYRESPRLHPFDPRKLVFAPRSDATQPYDVEVFAYVPALRGELEDSSTVEQVLIYRSQAVAKNSTVADKRTAPTWPHFLGTPARFGVRSLRDATLEQVRVELELALGIEFVRVDERPDAPVFGCTTPARSLRLNSWPSENPEVHVFNFVGAPSGETGDAAIISDELAAHLRGQDCDWYVPDELELLEDDGALGDRVLNRDALVSMLAPRWVSWFTGDDREAAMQVLTSIVDSWLAAAKRASDPVADVKRRRAHLQRSARHVPPRSRLRILASYAIDEQLSIIDEELIDLKEMSPAERAALPGTAKRLAEWREVVAALDQPVRSTGINSLRSFYEEVLAAIDELAKQTGYAPPCVEETKPGDGMREQLFLPEDVLATETIAAIADLGYVPEHLYETDPMPFEIEFHSAQSPGTRINYVQNNQINIQYLNIDGPDAVRVRQALAKVLRHYDRSTSYQCATSDPDIDERVTALFHLALARAPIPEAHVLRLIGEFLRQPKDIHRHSAVLSIAYFEWPAAVAMLDDLIQREKNPEILADAKLLRGRLQLPPERAPITGFERLMVDAQPRSEMLWARRWIDDTWAISSIPQVAYNLSIGDVVEAEWRDGVYHMTQLRTKSGNRSLRIDVGADPKRAEDVESVCRQFGIRYEMQQSGRVAVDAPPHVDLHALARAFESRGLSWEQADPQPT